MTSFNFNLDQTNDVVELSKNVNSIIVEKYGGLEEKDKVSISDLLEV